MLKKNLILTALMPLLISAAEVKKIKNDFFLVNDRIKVRISPDKSGKVTGLYDLKNQSSIVEGKDSGICSLFAESLFDKGNYYKVTNCFHYRKYKVLSSSSGKVASVAVSSPDGLPLHVTKVYSLKDGDDFFTVDYEVTNPGEKDFIGALFINNGIRIPGETRYTLSFPEGNFNQGNRGWIPGPKRVENLFTYEPGKSAGADIFVHDPIRDYVLLGGKKTGIIMEFPFSVMDFLYTHCSRLKTGSANVGFFTTAFQLPPLSKGKKEAVLLAVMDDPLAAYKYRFSIRTRIVEPGKISYSKYRAPSGEKKSEAFAPRISGGKMYDEFTLPAIIRERKPLRKIKLTAVAIAHGNPEMGELNRRLKTDMALVDSSNATSFRPTNYFGWKMPQPEMVLQAALEKKPEIILLTGHRENIIPRSQKERIIKLVEDGASLIFVSQNNYFPSLIAGKEGRELPPEFFRGMLKDRLPGFGKTIVYKRGKGKVFHVRFNMGPLKNETWLRESRVVIPQADTFRESFPYWEYYFSFYGRLFRCAANVKSPAVIKDISVSSCSAVVEIKADRDISGAVLHLTADDPAGRRSEKTVWRGALKKGINKLKVSIGNKNEFAALNGEYLLFFSLDSGIGTLDWFDTVFTHTSPNAISALDVKKIFTNKENISGSVVLQGKGDLSVKLREVVTGRISASAFYPAAHGVIRFNLKREVVSAEKLYAIEAGLQNDGKIVSLCRKNILIQPDVKSRENIRPLIWGPHITSWRDREFNRELRDMGFRIFLSPVALQKSEAKMLQEAEESLACGMEYAPLGFEHIKSVRPKRYPYTVRQVCLRSQPYKKRLKERAAAISSRLNKLMSEYCFISDEISLGHFFDLAHDFCFSPYCMAAFRKELKEKYAGDLTRLNANWKTDFRSWNEVKPDTREDAGKRGHYTSAHEHRLFMMKNMTEACRMLVDGVKKNSNVQVGISGMGLTGVYMGFDLMESMKYMDCSALYDSPFVIDMVRSSMKPGQITGAYTDYGARYRVWSQLIGGLRTPAVWWYGQLFRRGDGKPGVEGLRLKKMFADLRDSGADRVLGEGKRKISPLTLVWSTPSLVASEIEKKNNPVSRAVFTANLDSWSQLICDSGMDMANVIAAEDLAKITPASNPVVILPCTIRLSDEQIKILEQYAAAGGVLIADLYPGKFDSFGVERKENKLYALFGITKMQKRLTGKNTAAGEWALPDILPGNIIGYAADAQSFCQLSTNSGKIPAVIIRKVGKGKTVYLNFAWNLYNKKSSSADDSSRGHRGLLKQIFECAGVNITGNHTLPPGSAFAEYGFGNARYMFVSRRAGKSKGEFALQLGRKMHVYDMFKHKYLGTMSVCKGFLKDNEVKFIGIFPEKLKKFTGTVSFDGRHINVSALRSHPAFSELVRIRVFFNGREIQQLGMTNMLTDTMKVKIDLGREPAKGKWNVLMTSAADGSKVEYSFVVR